MGGGDRSWERGAFGVVSRVGSGIYVLEGSTCPKGKGRFEVFSSLLVCMAF